MPLRRLQRRLEQLYEIEVGHDVDDFLTTDVELVRRLDAGPAARDIPEKLLLRQCGEEVEVSLYLDAALLARLGEDDPSERLHDGNLGDFCTALEGVSHFLYVAWNTRYDRPVSLLELELQAEVDKFMLAALLYTGQAEGWVPRALHRRLFFGCAFDAALSAEERVRYWRANDYAARYCEGFLRHLGDRGGHHRLTNELRRFYRLGQKGKIHRIARH
jgi:hypothetical protein